MKPTIAMIYARDIKLMTAFYRDVMQFAVVRELEDWVELDAGDFQIALHAIPSVIAANVAIATPPEPRSGTPIKLLFESTDLGALRARLGALGLELASRRRDGVSPPDHVDGFDVEGNVFAARERS
jgi:catechol 2,3-dioxygenase-like lactoylglutathione lyase family enzyme